MKKRILLTFILIIFSAFSLATKEKLHLKIGTYENSPKIFTDEDGDVRGFWAEITEYIAQHEDWEIGWIHGTWDQCLQRLENNEIDIMIDVGLTPAGQKRFAFSNETVLMSWTRLYTHHGTELQSILDLEGKKIAGLKGSFNIEGPEGLRDIIEKFDINCEIIEMDDYIKVFEALNNKEIYAGITNKDFGAIHEQDYQVARTSIIFQPARMQYAFSKDSELIPYIIERVDHQIIELKKDKNSIYYKSMDKYLGGEVEVVIFPPWLKLLLAIIIIVIVTVFIFDIILRNQVVKRTAQLKKSEEQFRLFAENVPGVVSIYQWYPDGHREYIYQGPGLEKIIGEELAKKIDEDHDEFFKLIPEEDFKALDEASVKAFKSNKHVDFEYRLKIDDSNIKWVRTLFSMIPQKNGVILWQGMIYDITERKQLEENLKESENKYRSLTETSSDVILSLDLEGKFTYISPAAKKIGGYSWKNLLGHPFTEIVAPEYIESTLKSFKMGINGKTTPLYEIEILHKDGQKIPVELNVSNLFDIKGNVIGRLAIVRDISDRKKTEELLEKSEEKYHAIFEATGTATMIVCEDTKIVQVNKECEIITGFAESELVGESWTKFVHVEDLEMMLRRQKARQKDADSVPNKYEVRLIDAKGDIRNTILSIGMIPNTKRITVSMLDITKRKKAEEELKKKINELEIFNDATVDRELIINKLRKEINELLKKDGKKSKYDIV